CPSHPEGMRAHALERDPEALENAGSDALALADEPEQQVLGADGAAAEPTRLDAGQRDDLLGSGREPDLARHGMVAVPDHERDPRPDHAQLEAQVGEDLRRDALTLA